MWLSKVRPGEIIDEVSGEPATRRITAKVSNGSAIRCEENVEDLAEAIYDNTPPDAEGNRPTHAECRLAAFEMLTTDPHRAAGLGPMLLDQLGDLCANRDLVVQPVIDLNITTSVNGYEHPTAVKTAPCCAPSATSSPTPRAVASPGWTMTTRRRTTRTARPARRATTTTHH